MATGMQRQKDRLIVPRPLHRGGVDPDEAQPVTDPATVTAETTEVRGHLGWAAMAKFTGGRAVVSA